MEELVTSKASLTHTNSHHNVTVITHSTRSISGSPFHSEKLPEISSLVSNLPSSAKPVCAREAAHGTKHTADSAQYSAETGLENNLFKVSVQAHGTKG